MTVTFNYLLVLADAAFKSGQFTSRPGPDANEHLEGVVRRELEDAEGWPKGRRPVRAFLASVAEDGVVDEYAVSTLPEMEATGVAVTHLRTVRV